MHQAIPLITDQYLALKIQLGQSLSKKGHLTESLNAQHNYTKPFHFFSHQF